MTLKSIKHNPFKIVQMFEEEVAEYTGAPYAVAVDSCTNALFLCCKYVGVKNSDIIIPSKTYLSVPQSIIHAGGSVVFDRSFEANNWLSKGFYQLNPTNIYDSAKLLTSDMYIPNSLMCLSFHIKKNIPMGKGGMILTDNIAAVDWFKKARYEGRSEKLYHLDDINSLGWNMYMNPVEAAYGLWYMQNYPAHNPPVGEQNGYKDLTEFPLFKNCKVV